MMDQQKLTQLTAHSNGKSDVASLDELHAIFIQNVSHELRTPLAIMQGYAELLRDGELGKLSAEQQEVITIIVDRAHELRTIVERVGIILASKVHATTSLPLSLGTMVTDVVEGRRDQAAESGLTLKVDLASDLPPLAGDPYQLQHALDCLVDNALKFTPGGGEVQMELYTEPGWVNVAVTDSGIGISQEDMERIFTPFYQIDGSTTRRYGGLGLGLAVADAVIKEHGGQIHVVSEPGQGSRFTVRLPVVDSLASGQQPAPGDVTLRRILIVDDEENVALTLQDGLEKLPDCQITIATSGEEALRHFEEGGFDLLITDYKMPGTDGMTLAARVRQLYPQTAIIMITAYSSDELRQQAAQASIRRILNKPVRLAEIRNVALETLEGSGGLQKSLVR